MRKIWHDEAWAEYIEWQTKDKKTLKKINYPMACWRLLNAALTMETNKSGMYEMDIMMNRCAKLRSDFLFGTNEENGFIFTIFI